MSRADKYLVDHGFFDTRAGAVEAMGRADDAQTEISILVWME